MQPRKELGYETRISRFAPLFLGVAIVVSAIVTMWLGRDVTFTGDELTWAVASPGMDLGTALQAHGGHLQLIPRVVYKLMLETIGFVYWPYRLLTVITMVVAALLLYRYLVKRVGAMVALVPCLIMLFFGSDPLHVIQGNGFTIIFSVVCGLGALLALDRRDTKGDVGASLLLICGAATYTTALPFIAGVTLLLLLEKNWRRLWVPAVPLILFGIWRIWLITGGVHRGGSMDLGNITEIPRWIFDALSAVLSALTGLGYGVTDISSSGPDDLLGPALAVIALLAIAWRFSRGSINTGIWVTLAIGFSLWSIQCLAADFSSPAFRAPADPRYLYPGAVVVIMIGAELVAGKKWSTTAYLALVAVGAFGLVSNVAQMRQYGNDYQVGAKALLEAITANSIYFDEVTGERVSAGPDPVVVATPGELLAAIAQRPYGGVDYTRKEILDLPAPERESIDRNLARSFKFKLKEKTRPAGSCVPLAPGSGRWVATLPAGEVAVVSGGKKASLSLGRFGDNETAPLGDLPAGAVRRLSSQETIDGTSWRIASTEPGIKVCRAE